MTITETMRARMMTARKNKDKKNCDFYSYVVGELEAARKAKQTTANPNPVLTEQEEIDAITALYNKSKKAISDTKEKVEETTPELLAFYAEKEAEMVIYAEFMPKQMSEEEIQVAIRDAFNMIPDDTHSSFNKGTIMKYLMPMVKGKADGKLVSQLVDEFIKSLN